MKKVLITGARGSLGQALQEVIQEMQSTQPVEMILTGSKDDSEHGIHKLDISNEEEVKQVIEQARPDIIVNCAAFTAVDLCEDEVEKANQVNGTAPGYLAKAANAVGALLIHISTDYVYSGDSNTPWKEEDPTHPLSVYGSSKLMGEENVKKYTDRYFILRTQWLYGKGKSFAATMMRLADAGNTIRVVADQWGCPTSALELARAIVFLFDKTEYGIYNAACSGQTNWYEYAKMVFELTGRTPEVIPVTTKEYKTKAVRPMYTVLDMSKWEKTYAHRYQNWESALKEVLTK